MAAAFLRFALVAAVLGAAVWAGSQALLTALLPAMRAVVEAVDADHRIVDFGLDREGADRVLRLTVTRSRYGVVGGRVLAPNPLGRGTASTLAGHPLRSIVLVFAAALALPASGIAALLLRITAAALVALACVLVDVPLVLVANIEGLYIDRFTPGAWSPWLAWSGFLEGGGRTALALGGGLLIARVIGRPT